MRAPWPAVPSRKNIPTLLITLSLLILVMFVAFLTLPEKIWLMGVFTIGAFLIVLTLVALPALFKR